MLVSSSGLIIVAISFLVISFALNRFGPRPDLLAPDPISLNASSNLLWPSQDFGNAKWVRYQIADVVPDMAKTPNGENTASRLIETVNNGRHLVSNTVGMAPGSVYTFSVYFQQGERSIRLEVGDAPLGKYGTALCDLSMVGPSGTSWVKGSDAVAAAVENVGGGWYRCWTAMSYTHSAAVLDIELRDQTGAMPYQGNGHSGVVIWGAQFEPGNKPTAYVATTNGPVAKTN